MASMALLDLVRPLSVDSNRPMSHLSSRSASSVLLVSSIASSDSYDYYTCTDEMDADQFPFEEVLFFNADLEEFNFPLNAEVDEQPSTVLISSVDVSPVASPSSSPCLPSLFPLTQPLTADQAMQSGEHDFYRLSEWATLVVWDPRLPGTFPPDSNMSILPPWWCNEECHGTFGYPAFTRLHKRLLSRLPAGSLWETLGVMTWREDPFGIRAFLRR
ncbi:MAG: hypothetical protein GY847_04430, partial [Proteobacteria bacterium]|nr:hypothetical protein [Pseudomonadota bacterium]